MSKSKARFLAELLSSDGKVIKTKSQASTIVVGDLPTIPNSKLANSSVTIAGEGLSLGASLSLDTGDITEHTNYKYYTDARAITAVSGSDLDMSGRKVLFGNMYSSTGDLPSASTYHGMFAHVHGTGKGYFAHAGSWVELANQSGLTTATTTANAALPKAGGAMTGAITTNSTFDGRNVSVDGTKLDGIAASANNYSHPSNHAISVITGLQTALDGKVDDSQVLTNVPSGAVFTDTNTTYSVGDGGLTTNNFTNADHTKLNAIEASADVTDSTNVVAALTAGTNITISAGGTIASTDTNTTYSVGDGGLSQNNFTNADHSKLDGIATGATNTAAPHYTSAIAVGDGGLTTNNFTTTLKNKLDGIAASANNYTLPSGYATESYVGTQITNLVDSSPAALNTLNELAAAIGDDASFSTTVTNNIATKLPLAGGTLTGILNTQRDIRSAGQIRATGWYNDAASTDYTGLGFEIGISGSSAFALAYNRGTGAYGPMTFNATYFDFNNQIKISGTTVIDSSRNITAGSITAGNFTPSGYISQGTGQSHYFRGGTDANWRIGSDITADSGGLVNSAAIQMIVGGGSSPNYGFQIFGHTTPTVPVFEVLPQANAASSITNIRGKLYINNTEAIDNSRNISAGTISATGGNSGNWNTAYGWGNHASGGYLSAETLSATNTVNVTGTKYWQPAGTAASPLGGGGGASLQAYTTGTTAAYMAFHRSGAYAINWGLDTSNTMVLGGWSSSTTAARMSIGTNGLMVTAGQGNLWGASNDGSGSGLDADLLDGLNSTAFIRSDTGTIPAARMPTVLPTTGNYNWSSSTTAGSYPGPGLQCAFVRSADGWPSYGSVLHVGGRGGSDAGGDFQILCGHGSGNGGNFLKFRNADNSASPSDAWTAWKTIWGSGNDGSGSGLDADLLDGLELHTGTNNEANKVVRTNASGYIDASYINTTSGAYTTEVPNRFYASNDAYVRYYARTWMQNHLGLSGKTSFVPRSASNTTEYYRTGSQGWASLNFNDMFNRGSCFIDLWSHSNGPTSGHSTGFQSLHYSSSNTYHHGMQMVMQDGNPSATYLRGWWANGGTGYAWQKIWTDGNDGSGSGLDADLLDGQHGTYYANEDARKSVPSSGNYQITNSTSPQTLGTGYLRHDFLNSAGPPGSSYRSVLSISSYTGGSQWTQLSFNYNQGINTPIYFRQNQYNGSSWGSWHQLWDSANDGSGSGLDADLLDGYNAEEGAVNNSIVKRDGSAMITAKKLYLNGGNYEGSIVFGATDVWRCGIRQHDDGDAELRIWAKHAAGRVHIATGYDGQPASISRPTDGFVVNANNVGIGNFSAVDPSEKLHVLGNILVTGNIVGNTSNTTEVGTYSTGGIKRIRMTQGGEIHFGDTTTINFLGITEGAVNNFADQDRLGIYYRNEMKFYSNSNALRQTFDNSGNHHNSGATYYGGASNQYVVGGTVYSSHQAVKIGGNWNEFECMGRVLDVSSSNCHFMDGYGSTNHSSHYLRIGSAGGGNGGLNHVHIGCDLNVTGNVTAYFSDARLKQNVETIPNALEILEGIRGVTFEWNKQAESVWAKKQGEKDFGMIAQEVEAVFPMGTIVQGNADKNKEIGYADPDSPNYDPLHNGELDEPEYKTIKYDKMVTLAIQAIKELKAEVDELKERLNSKENK